MVYFHEIYGKQYPGLPFPSHQPTLHRQPDFGHPDGIFLLRQLGAGPFYKFHLLPGKFSLRFARIDLWDHIPERHPQKERGGQTSGMDRHPRWRVCPFMHVVRDRIDHCAVSLLPRQSSTLHSELPILSAA